jgi:hypothetical protein
VFRKRITFVVAAAFAAGFLATEAAYGQACIGVPIPQGSYGGQVDVGFGDGSISYGASVTANLAGRLSVGAGYGLTTADGASNAHNFSGRVAFELPGLPLSACALTGFRYVRVSGSDDVGSVTTSSFLLPVGVALVHPFPLSLNVTVTPYITPQFLVRFSPSGDGADGQGDTETGFELRKGIVVGIRRVFVGLDAELFTSLEGSAPGYRVSVGMRF